MTQITIPNEVVGISSPDNEWSPPNLRFTTLSKHTIRNAVNIGLLKNH